MSAWLANPRVQLVLRLALGVFFAYASLDKIASPPAFAKVVYQWQVVGPVPSNLVAVTLPWVELLAGLLLVVGAWKREAALATALLLVVFIVAAGSVMARGIDVLNCGCVSLAKEAAEAAWPPAWMKGVGWFLVARNLLLLGVSLAIVRVPTPAGSDHRQLLAREQQPNGQASGGRSTAAPPGPPRADA